MKTLRIFAMILCCALFFSFNVYADDINTFYPFYALDQNNIHYVDIEEAFNLPDNSLGQNGETLYNPGKVGLGIFNQLKKDYTYVYEIELQMNRLSGDSTISTELYNYGFYNNKITLLNNSKNNNIEITVTKQSPSIFVTVVFNTVDNNNIYGNDYFYFSLLEDFQKSYSRFKFTNVKVSSVYDSTLSEFDQIIGKLDEITSNQESNSEDIQSALSNIINNQIIQNNNWNTIINYGSHYNQVDQTLISGLGTAEDQLSNAEDAIQNKSQSLVDKVASQWTANKGVASSFITTITPASSAIGTVTDNFFDAIPEEIKNAVITIMLIVFIGWLIGRIEG